ncbi:MAG: 23S rRNA (pseudouridine(1915)-N(3))-methyltransferase RlmH [Candidatus Omnitrophica bacterium]|nr:23S rRNA (pseudouridine(1915)-N(3))-methyltransferase RlmH [Candidatus Omnitrophota bacterium]
MWSFGPLTLPHEIAAVVASEQIYRAWTLIRKFSYHSEHVLR